MAVLVRSNGFVFISDNINKVTDLISGLLLKMMVSRNTCFACSYISDDIMGSLSKKPVDDESNKINKTKKVARLAAPPKAVNNKKDVKSARDVLEKTIPAVGGYKIRTGKTKKVVDYVNHLTEQNAKTAMEILKTLKIEGAPGSMFHRLVHSKVINSTKGGFPHRYYSAIILSKPEAAKENKTPPAFKDTLSIFCDAKHRVTFKDECTPNPKLAECIACDNYDPKNIVN